MPSYTTLIAAGRTKVLRTTADNTTVALTTITDPAAARSVAKALTNLAFDLPASMVDAVDALTGRTLPLGDEDHDWLHKPAPEQAAELTRALLSGYDNPPTAAVWPPSCPLDLTITVAKAAKGQPESVCRAVRGEVASLLSGYDDVPVLGRAYDRKWGDANTFFVANTALAVLTDEELVSMCASGDAEFLLDRLPIALDDTHIGPVADNGYLSVELHPGQLRAWLVLNRPHLGETMIYFGA